MKTFIEMREFAKSKKFIGPAESNEELLERINNLGSIEEYRYWLVSGVFSTLPMKTQLSIAEKYIEIGYPTDARFIVKMIKEIVKRNREYFKLTQQTLEKDSAVAYYNYFPPMSRKFRFLKMYLLRGE